MVWICQQSLFDSAVAAISSRLLDPLLLHLAYPFSTRTNITDLDNFIKRLLARRDDIAAEIRAAQRKQRSSCRREVEEWLQSVEAADGEAGAIRDAYNRRRRCLGNLSIDMVSRYKTSKRAAELLIRARELYDRGVFDALAIEAPPPPIEEKPVASPVIGMRSKLEKVLLHLGDDKVGVVGVWGMGGVGKTTLMKTINNHFLAGAESLRFDHVICITASKGCKIENLQTDIARKIGLSLNQDSGTESHASAIHDCLKNKKFLLLLDDLWERVDLSIVGVPRPMGVKNQRMVLATRMEEVCGHMKAHIRIKLDCLEPNKAWELFTDNVGTEIVGSDARICRLAEKVCKRCCGLPLALIAIGRAMSTKRTWQEWENAINYLESRKTSEMSGMKDVSSVLSTLRFSYDSLEGDGVKECFLACCLWPESYSIWKIDLMHCWIGTGLLPIHNTIEETYNNGESRIGSLKRACLLEDGDEKGREVRLHDVIRDMALSIVSEFTPNWTVQAGLGLKRVTRDDMGRRWAGASRVSIMCNYIQSLPHSVDCPHLSTLMLQQNFHLDHIPPTFFRCMPALTYLDLSWTPIKELPREIGSLVYLRYLNLKNSDIFSLPAEVGDLTNLMFLDLSYTNNLKHIPHGVISRLGMLQVLNLFQSLYEGFETELNKRNESGNEPNEFSLQELQCLDRAMLSLGVSARTVRALRMLSKLPDVHLFLLGLNRLQGVSSLSLRLRRSIKILNIKACLSLEELHIGNGHGDGDGYRLEYVTLWRLPKLKRISLDEGDDKWFLKLWRLNIVENNDLQDVSWIRKLPYLEHLDLSLCNGLKQVVGDATKEDLKNAFSRLRTLQLNCLPVFERFASAEVTFPSLEYMDVFGCPLLKKLPFHVEFGEIGCLRRIRGEEEWWEHLEWDDAAARLALRPLFTVFEKNLETFEPGLDTNPFMASADSFFARRDPMMRTAMQFSSHLASLFGSQVP